MPLGFDQQYGVTDVRGKGDDAKSSAMEIECGKQRVKLRRKKERCKYNKLPKKKR
jgi:hypothetical protein